MRLGQLSRKIGTRPAEIVQFLSSQGVVVQDNPNSRVDDREVKAVLSKFAPHIALEDVIQDEPAEYASAAVEREENQEQESIEVRDAVSDATSELTETVPETSSENVPAEVNGSPEVIKAPKIELQGLKVLGKIDLPQPKKKETQEAPPPTEDAAPPKSERRERRPPRNGQRNGERQRREKNPIAMQREREAREAAERKKEALKKEKDSRTQFYLSRVKPVAPVKKASLVDEPLSQLKDEAPDQPRTLWGKFVKWLTSH